MAKSVLLTIDDDRKIHAIQVPEPGGYHWRWRIWLPKGHDYWVFVADTVPKKGIPHPRSEGFLGAGGKESGKEISVQFEVRPNENGKRCLYISRNSLNSKPSGHPFFEVEETKWIKGEVMVGEDVTGAKSQVSSSVDEPLVLLRFSEDERSTKENPPHGLFIWISTSRKF